MTVVVFGLKSLKLRQVFPILFTICPPKTGSHVSITRFQCLLSAYCRFGNSKQGNWPKTGLSLDFCPWMTGCPLVERDRTGK